MLTYQGMVIVPGVCRGFKLIGGCISEQRVANYNAPLTTIIMDPMVQPKIERGMVFSSVWEHDLIAST